jgi:heme-degrading monooxygenase HmoA
MFARVSTYSAEDADKVVQGFESVREPLERMEGFSHAYFMVDRAGGKALSITVWDSEDALNASVAKADELRRQGAQTGGASIESVAHYEIALEIGTASAAG